MLVGYARVSSSEQETTLQRDALARAGVDHVFEEKRSAVARRPQLAATLASLSPGDVLVVYKVDRLARSLVDLLQIVQRVVDAGAVFRSLTEPIDTGTPAGRMTLQLLGAFAEFERAMIRERSIAGQEAARERGARIGRPRALSEAEAGRCYSLWLTGDWSKSALAREFGCHLSSIKRVILRVESPESSAVAHKRQGPPPRPCF